MIRTLSLILLTLAVAGSCAKGTSDTPPQEQRPTVEVPPPVANGLTRVEDPSLVCMVNNTFMGKAQIPIEVDGKTYFGCCEMCKGRLANDPSSRMAVDPVSGQAVDKAIAVMAKDAQGSVLYFASNETLRAYR